MEPMTKRCRVIAELSCSHGGYYEVAVSLILNAKYCGADAVKMQMFKAEEMTLARQDWRVKSGPWAGMTLMELYQKAQTPYDWIPSLKGIAERIGLDFIVSVYHPDTVPICEEMGIQSYKIASYELGWPELIRAVGKTRKRVYLSTGGWDYSGWWQACQTVRQAGCKDFWLLHCISEYPAKPEQMNLATLLDLGRHCNGRVGLSDHSRSDAVVATAVALGAKVVEKHLTPHRDGLDGSFALIPSEFQQMVKTVREAEQSVGQVFYWDHKTFHRMLVDGKMVRTVHGNGQLLDGQDGIDNGRDGHARQRSFETSNTEAGS